MILEAKKITKSYVDLSILNGVNLEVKEKEIVSIVGSSGAGKTTLLQILGTLDHPSSGELIIDNTNPFELNQNDLSAFRNQKLGFIFQFHQLLPEFTAAENVKCIHAIIIRVCLRILLSKRQETNTYSVNRQ